MKKILVTGGAGFIGSHIVDAYINLGFQVIVVDNFSTGKQKNINFQAKLYVCDITNREDLENVFLREKPDYVNHHAAQVRVIESIENPTKDASTNLFGLINVLECSVHHKVKKFIFASSGGALYPDNPQKPSVESDDLVPCSPYGLAKKTGEMYLDYFHKMYQLPCITLRYSNVYGPRQNLSDQTGVISLFLQSALNNHAVTVYGNGSSTRDYVYIDDVVAANVLALKSKITGIFNISTSRETSIKELLQILKKINPNMKVNFKKVRIGEQQRSVLSFSEAEKMLNWTPKVSLDEGVAKYLEFLKKSI